MVRARSTVALLGVTAAVLGLTACKSSDSGKSSGSALKKGVAIHLLVDTSITGGPATGGVAFPQPVAGAKAAAGALNNHGGINGHKIVIDSCDNKTDPNGGATCARRAVQNGDLAVVGSFDIVGAAKSLPILQTAGIPYVGGLPGSPQELSNPISFQFDGGVNVGGFGTVKQMKDAGCVHAAEFSPGGPAAATDPLLAQEMAKAGIKFTRIVASAGAADMSAVVSQALAVKPDCVMAEGPGQDTAKIIAALRKQGAKVKIYTSIGSLVPQVLAALGHLADGVFADNTTLLADSTDPTVTRFRNDMIAALGRSGAAANLNEFGQDGWSAVMVVAQALKGVTDITSKSLLAALNTMTAATAGNVHDPVDFTKPRDSKLFPRLFNPYVRYFVVRNGAYTQADDQWHDAGEYIP